MFCSKCGAKLPEGANFCQSCGTKQIAVQKKAKLGLLIGGAAVMLVVLLVALLGGKKDPLPVYTSTKQDMQENDFTTKKQDDWENSSQPIENTSEVLTESEEPQQFAEEPTVPSFEEFTDNCAVITKTETEDNYTYYYHIWNYERQAMEEYIALLEKNGFTLLQHYHDDKSDDYDDYVFAYNSSEDVNSFVCPQEWNGLTEVGVLYMKFLHIASKNANVNMYMANELSFASTDERTTCELIPYKRKGSSSGNSSSGSSSSSGGSTSSGNSSSGESSSSSRSESPSLERRCTTCDGDGNVTCSACGGDGGKYVEKGSTANYSGKAGGSKTIRVWEKCISCRGTGEKSCQKCGGDGRW